jgi:hypothetical protein
MEVTDMEIMKANAQWSSRPEDERFTTLEAMHAACVNYAAGTAERNKVDASTLRAEVVGTDVALVGRGGVPATLTHWSFGQLAQRASAPASYLRSLPAALAVENINHGLRNRAVDDLPINLLVAGVRTDSLTVRAITSDRYSRIWNHEITERLLQLQSRGWEVARPDIRDSGDGRRPLYASDHDMFAFLRSDRVINEAGNHDGLRRGVIVENSEVGASKLRLTRFLYRAMCGNHIIWDASEVTELALRHVGDVRGRMSQWDAEIRKYLDSSVSADEAGIAAAMSTRIAGTKDEVLDKLFGLRIPALTRKALDASYDAVVFEEDGDARNVWGIVQGITRFSQSLPYADARTELDRAAGMILAEVF